MLLGTESVGLEVPTNVVWGVVGFVGFGIIGWLAKAKADRWDAAADRTHDHANAITALRTDVDNLKGKKK